MKFHLLAVAVIFLATIAAAQDIRVANLSSKYDLIAKQSNCKDDWRGVICDQTIHLFRKNARKLLQSISFRGGDMPPIFGDFNFDGHEDIAICDGTNGGYVTPSYRVYLYSPSRAKFVFSSSFTALSQGPAMGFFDVNKRNRTVTNSSREGCCYFWTRTYDMYRGEPRMIYERIDDESSAERIWAVITTKKLINGKWRTWQKRERIPPIPTK